jgi:hypothetical protein
VPAQGAHNKRFTETLVQAVEAVICTFGIVWGFALAHKPGAIWALVSAVIVLRPGFEDSLRASEVRIAANVVGALVGVVVSVAARSSGPVQIALALALVILICHWPPLEKVRAVCLRRSSDCHDARGFCDSHGTRAPRCGSGGVPDCIGGWLCRG